MALWKAEGIDLYCLTADSFPDIYQFPESTRNKLIGCYSNGIPQTSSRQVAFGNSTDYNSLHETIFYTFPTGEQIGLRGGKQYNTQIQVAIYYHYDPNDLTKTESVAFGANSNCTCLGFVMTPETANPNNTTSLGDVKILLFAQGPAIVPSRLAKKMHGYTWTTNIETNPISYIPVNSILSGPSSASQGEIVNVDVSFPDGYIYQENGISVYDKNGKIPFTYSDGRLTFTMP